MAVVATQVVDVQRRRGMVGESLEELVDQVDVELPDPGTPEVDAVLDSRAPGKVDHHARQGLIQRHIGMPVTHDPLLVAQRLLERLPQGDADVFDAMVIVDMQIAFGTDIDIKTAMAGNLLEHVFEKGDSSIKIRPPTAIKIDGNANLSFQGIATDACTSIWHFIDP